MGGRLVIINLIGSRLVIKVFLGGSLVICRIPKESGDISDVCHSF
jgi:hypothetical protein